MWIIGAKGIATKWTQDHVPGTQGIKFGRGKEGKIEKVMDSSAKEICSYCSEYSQDQAHGILQNPWLRKSWPEIQEENQENSMNSAAFKKPTKMTISNLGRIMPFLKCHTLGKKCPNLGHHSYGPVIYIHMVIVPKECPNTRVAKIRRC